MGLTSLESRHCGEKSGLARKKFRSTTEVLGGAPRHTRPLHRVAHIRQKADAARLGLCCGFSRNTHLILTQLMHLYYVMLGRFGDHTRTWGARRGTKNISAATQQQQRSSLSVPSRHAGQLVPNEQRQREDVRGLRAARRSRAERRRQLAAPLREIEQSLALSRRRNLQLRNSSSVLSSSL